MQTYLAIIENSQGSFVIFAAAGVFIASILLCLLISARYRNKLVSLDTELKKERVTHEQACVQLTAAQEKTQQLEEELTAQAGRVEQLESDKQAAQIVAERVAELEQAQQAGYALLAEKEAALEALANRLHSEEQRYTELEQAQRTGLVEQEAALEALRNTINEQAVYTAKTELDFDQRLNHADAAFSKLEAKYQSYKTYIGKLALGRMQVFNDLNIAAHKLHQLETELKAKEIHIEAMAQRESRYQEQRVIEAVEHVEATQEVLPESRHEEQSVIATPAQTGAARPLFARIVNAVKADFGLKRQISVEDEAVGEVESQQAAPEYGRQLAEKEAVIDALKAELDARQHHISRLEDALETKNRGVTAGQTPDPNHAAEAEAINPTAISKVVEKAAHFPQDIKAQWLSLFKKQTHDADESEQPSSGQIIEPISPVQPPAEDEDASKTGYIPGQLKDLYKKMTSFTH